MTLVSEAAEVGCKRDVLTLPLASHFLENIFS